MVAHPGQRQDFVPLPSLSNPPPPPLPLYIMVVRYAPESCKISSFIVYNRYPSKSHANFSTM